MKTSILLVLICLDFGLVGFGQVKHNFEVGPEKTDCHKLPQTFAGPDSALVYLERTTFRLHEHVTISRYRVPNQADYYSCDGSKGFLVVREDSTTLKFYRDVPIEIWETFTSTRDPMAFYEDEIRKLEALFKDQ